MKIVKILIGLASCYFLLRWLGGGSAPTGVIVAAVLALIVAALVVMVGWFSARRLWKISQSWPSVPGRIVEESLGLFTSGTAMDNNVKAKKECTAFTYVVEGQDWDNTHDSKIDKKPGDEIRVFYNPKQPKESVIDLSYTNPGLTGLALGVGLSVMVFAVSGSALYFR